MDNQRDDKWKMATIEQGLYIGKVNNNFNEVNIIEKSYFGDI